jgi:general secretion pathway protein D
MKKLFFFVIAVVALWMGPSDASAQVGGSPADRRGIRGYTSPQELVSIAPTTPFDRALSIISEVSKRFTGKIVIDSEHRTFPIKLDIQGMQWRDALEAICRKNGVWYNEYDDYIQITSSTGGGQEAGGESAQAPTGKIGFHQEPANLSSREVKIYAYFLEVNLTKLDEVGLNWNFMKTTKDVAVASSFGGADKVSDNMFSTSVTPKVSFANIDVLAKLFSNYNLGEILSGPQIIVRSGEEGRIQVGQDFSIRERDFAGNLIDKFYSAGTIITVTPQVITEQGVSFIHLNVAVERSDVTPGPISTIVNKTKANTNLLLLDGEESIIGGLYSHTINTTRSGVPFLKDLPWYVLGLRYIFGYSKDEVQKKELIILLKAELVPTIQERIAQKRKEDGVFNRWLQEQERMKQHIIPYNSQR